MKTHNNTYTPRSALPEVEWPAIPRPDDAVVLAMLGQLEQSQWWSPEHLLEHQLKQALHLIRHAASTVPFYQTRLAPLAITQRPLLLEEFQKLPELKRSDLQTRPNQFVSNALPDKHSPTLEVSTSGSTGTPVRVLSTPVTQLLYRVFGLRFSTWHGRDSRQSNMSVRLVRGDQPKVFKGSGWMACHPPGPAYNYCSSLSLTQIFDGLVEHQPVYLQAYPMIVDALIRHSIARGFRPERLREIRTFGGVLDNSVRELCRDTWNVPISDNYSAVETGIIALQCPETDHLHVQSENVLLEVVHPDGSICKEGETGRILVTVLHNFATPMIRYDMGDYAEVAGNCSCGRGLPALKRIVGRHMNLFTLPDGSRIIPHVSSKKLAKLIPLQQYQLWQRTLTEVDVNLVTGRALTTDDENKLRNYLNDVLSPQFQYTFHVMDEIPRGATGKYETVWSELPQA